MTAARLIENGITRKLLRRREREAQAGSFTPDPQLHWQGDIQPWLERVIAILAVTTGLLFIGSLVEELLWVALAASTVFTLR
jgi:hypothetical protein